MTFSNRKLTTETFLRFWKEKNSSSILKKGKLRRLIMETLRERCMKAQAELPQLETVSHTHLKTGNTVQLTVPHQLRIRLPERYRRMQEEINNADIERSQKMKMEIVMAHMQEQKAKGNITATGEKGPNFEKHALPEINAILYGYHNNPHNALLTS
jgi:hypothetical protein